MVVNTIDKDRGNASKDGFIIRREAVEHGIPLFTSLDTADAIVRVMESRAFQLTLFNGEHMLRQKTKTVAGGTDETRNDGNRSAKQLAPKIFEMTLKGDLVKEMQQPGQFLHILVPRADLLLRRPISLNHIDHETNTCRIIYRVEGEGTRVFYSFCRRPFRCHGSFRQWF